MPSYKYRAYDSQGKIVESTILAQNEDEVARQLDEMDLVPVEVKKIESKTRAPKVKTHVKPEVVLLFTKQLYTMLKAGIPILLALQTVKEQTKNENFKEIIETIYREIEQGSKFSDTLSQFPKVFSDIFINAIKIGEVSGTLEESLQYMHQYMEKDLQIRNDVKKAFRYPMFVVIGIIGAFFVFVTTVIPNFVPMFKNSGHQLPLPTRILLGIYSLMTQYGLISSIVLTAVIVAIIYFIKTPKGRMWLDSTMLKVPIFGQFLQKVIVARFARLFYTMNRTGVNITESLKIIQKSLGNVIYNKEIEVISDSIMKGEGIADSLRKSSYFPELLVDMVSIGEKSGSLDDMLLSVSNYYEEEVADMVENMSSLIEPIITVALGGMILLLALALFLPMWEMMNILK